MRNVTYFSPYSNKENVVTNAVLLLLAQVNRLAPSVFSSLLTTLTDEEYNVGPTFQNQIKISGKKSVPDALIQQAPFKIYVETKLGDELNLEQIRNHFQTIEDRETVKGKSVLLGLARTKIDCKELVDLQKKGEEKKIRFFVTTFSDLANILENLSGEFRLELNLLIKEFKAFIQELGLVCDSEYKLLINPCGESYTQNCQNNIYHDQPTRSKVFCKYLGLYKDQSVSRIGEVLAVMNAYIQDDKVEITENHQLSWCTKLYNPTADDKKKILNHARETETNEEARYYIVNKFVWCKFKKTSPHGLLGHRYFSLKEIIPERFKGKSPQLEEVATALSEKTWE